GSYAQALAPPALRSRRGLPVVDAGGAQGALLRELPGRAAPAGLQLLLRRRPGGPRLGLVSHLRPPAPGPGLPPGPRSRRPVRLGHLVRQPAAHGLAGRAAGLTAVPGRLLDLVRAPLRGLLLGGLA